MTCNILNIGLESGMIYLHSFNAIHKYIQFQVKQEVEWKDSYNEGVQGCWNPDSQMVEWKTCYNSGTYTHYIYHMI